MNREHCHALLDQAMDATKQGHSFLPGFVELFLHYPPDLAPIKCEWSEEDPDDDMWYTSCGDIFALNEGPPSANGMKYCCFCGKLIVEISYKEEADNAV